MPVQLIGVEDDPLFPAEVLEEGKKALIEHSVTHDVKVYPGVPHGKFEVVKVLFVDVFRFCCNWRIRVENHHQCTDRSIREYDPILEESLISNRSDTDPWP